jgi:O-antigen ligase
VVLVGAAWTLPFLHPYHLLPITSFHSEWLAFALGLGAVMAGTMVTGRTSELQQAPAVAIGAIFLSLLCTVHAVLGHALYTGNALNPAGYLLWAAFLAALGATVSQVLGTRSLSAILAWSLVIGGLASAAAGLIQHYQWDTPLNFLVAPKKTPAVYGNLGSYGHFASYVALALASAVYLHVRGALYGPLCLAFVTVFLFVLTLSGARSVWLYLAALLVLAWAFHRRARSTDSLWLLRLALLILPSFLFAQWAATLPIMQPPEHVITAGERLFELETATGPRLLLARVAWDMFLDAPLFGAGFGQFAWPFFEAAASSNEPFYGLQRHAHNIILHLLAETGITGASATAVVGLVWIWGFRHTPTDIHKWWLLALLSVIGVHSLLENPLWYSYFLGIAAFLLGMGETRFLAVRPRMMVFVTTMAVTLGGYVILTTYTRYLAFERALYASSAMSPGMGDDVISEQLKRNYRDLTLAPNVELIVARSFPLSEDRLAEKIQLNSRVIRFAPNSQVVFRQAVLLALAGETAESERLFRQAVRVYPASLSQYLARLRELAVSYPTRMQPLLMAAFSEEARQQTSFRSP